MLSEDNSAQVASISKQWRGLCAEAFTDADNFAISFPMDMEVRTKALLVGALFLIVSLISFLPLSVFIFHSYPVIYSVVYQVSPQYYLSVLYDYTVSYLLLHTS